MREILEALTWRDLRDGLAFLAFLPCMVVGLLTIAAVMGPIQ